MQFFFDLIALFKQAINQIKEGVPVVFISNLEDIVLESLLLEVLFVSTKGKLLKSTYLSSSSSRPIPRLSIAIRMRGES